MKNLVLAFVLIMSMPSQGQDPMVPVLNQLIPDVVLTPGEEGVEYDLSEHFGMEAILDEAVRLTAGWTLLDGTEKTADLDFLLFKDRTPITRDNFLGYVNRGDYVDMIVHRLVPGFVIQGGGFTIMENDQGDPVPENVTTQDPIQNEFGVSNTLGTISMAKVGGDPNSATSQWFISTGANSDNLDFQNEGFTVFGVVSRESFPRALELDRLEEFEIFNLGGAFTNTPLVDGTTNATFTVDRFYLFQSVQEVPLPPDQASMDPALVFGFQDDVEGGESEILIVDGDLVMNVVEGQLSGRKVVVLEAQDSVGNKVVDTFEVTVEADYQTWREQLFSPEDAADDAVSGPLADPNGDGVTNLTLFGQGLPVDQEVTALAPRIRLSGNAVQVETETPYRVDLELALEASDDLEQWQEVQAVRSTQFNRQDKTEVFRVTGDSRSFYRVRYSLD